MALTGLNAMLTYAQQVPNWAPQERFLPNADYGRVGALKLVENVFEPKITQYINAQGPSAWALAGAYHYYLLGRQYKNKGNEHTRVGLTGPPTPGIFNYADVNVSYVRDGPYYVQDMMAEITEYASTYGFPVQTVMSAILTMAEGLLSRIPNGSLVFTNANFGEGALAAKYNFRLIESLWGV